MILDDIMEQLAAIEHDRWSGQARTALDNMTPERRERWDRLSKTAYEDLSEEMKELDRMQVREYWPIIEEALLRKERTMEKKIWVEDLLDGDTFDAVFEDVATNKTRYILCSDRELTKPDVVILPIEEYQDMKDAAFRYESVSK